MIIAVDFDGTLCSDCYPDIGIANAKLIRTLRKKQELGDKLILWTCRVGERFDEAIEWCREQGLLFDAINDNLPEMIALWGSNSRKITADTMLYSGIQICDIIYIVWRTDDDCIQNR